MFTGGGSLNQKVVVRSEFRRVFANDQSLHNALGLRSRVMPIVGSSISEICEQSFSNQNYSSL
jgi:hypothetical protein